MMHAIAMSTAPMIVTSFGNRTNVKYTVSRTYELTVASDCNQNDGNNNDGSFVIVLQQINTHSSSILT